MLELIKKRKINRLGYWLRRICLLKDALEAMIKGKNGRNDKREESSQQKKISDDRQCHDKWTVCRYEKEG